MAEYIDLLGEEYNGDFNFKIADYDYENDYLYLTLKADYNEKVAGIVIKVPVIIKKQLFKTLKVIDNTRKIEFESVDDECSKVLLTAFENVLKPDFKVTKKFTPDLAELDFQIENRQFYDMDSEKIYLKIYYDEEDTQDIPKDERIHIELKFNFNIPRMRATLSESKKGYTNDFLTVIME